MEVKGKKIIVTGGGSGIGRELVLELLKKGASVIALDLNKTALEETTVLAQESKASLSVYELDISNQQASEALAEKLISESNIDGVINNAGIIQPFVKFNNLDYPTIERVMNVNFYGTLYLTKALLPHLLKRPEAHIVNVSSMGGFLPVPGQTIYGSAKAAVKLFTEGLRSELMDTKVNVSIVFPGAIGTDIAKNSGLGTLPGGNQKNSMKTMPAPKAAQEIIKGMEANSYRILVGSDAKFMDFIYRLNPKFAAKFIYSKMKSLLPE
ncbi:SDR family oxidoreductase [Cytophagaceae bacterium ABcell3]|nr:SDR family oxidoreductase [Cytophagaceae bacterium ABcell3]